MQIFTPKQPGETLNIGFDFSDVLSPAETLVSATVTVSVLRGIDAHPENLKSGDAQILGTVASQFITGGVSDVTYLLSCSAVTSDPQTLINEGVLEVRTSNQSSVFFIKAIDVGQLRTNQSALSGTNFNFSAISDDALWQSMVAAEADLARKLGVSLSPIEIFTDPPTDEELIELAGKPYLIEPGYDLPPNFFGIGKFGCFRLRQVPVVEIKSIKLVYPNTGSILFNIPIEWVRCDYKYGLIHIFPSRMVTTVPLSIFTMQALTSGVNVPNMIRVRYSSGLKNVVQDYPDIVALAKRMAVLRIINDSWLPLSESISADGLSQSQSNDIEKLQKVVDNQIDALKTRVLGPVYDVV